MSGLSNRRPLSGIGSGRPENRRNCVTSEIGQHQRKAGARRGFVRRLLLPLALWCGGALAALLLAAVILPMPSTLMLARFATGAPVERYWVALDEVSPQMVRAVIASEDQRFCTHAGVDFGALREVLSDEDGPSRGASTIAMQTVKNLYLWHGRSWVRKALEIPLALAADLAWSKRRTMTLYLNIAEFGEGLFGVEAAARRYYGKSASRLSAREAAELTAALPNPRLRHPRAGSPRARANTQVILSRMAGLESRADCVLP
jgi:monofunctional glycosyltransferase